MVLVEVHVSGFAFWNVRIPALTISLLLVVTSLTSQRNAIAMLHERMRVLLAYVVGVINGE